MAFDFNDIDDDRDEGREMIANVLISQAVPSVVLQKHYDITLNGFKDSPNVWEEMNSRAYVKFNVANPHTMNIMKIKKILCSHGWKYLNSYIWKLIISDAKNIRLDNDNIAEQVYADWLYLKNNCPNFYKNLINYIKSISYYNNDEELIIPLIIIAPDNAMVYFIINDKEPYIYNLYFVFTGDNNEVDFIKYGKKKDKLDKNAVAFEKQIRKICKVNYGVIIPTNVFKYKQIEGHDAITYTIQLIEVSPGRLQIQNDPGAKIYYAIKNNWVRLEYNSLPDYILNDINKLIQGETDASKVRVLAYGSTKYYWSSNDNYGIICYKVIHATKKIMYTALVMTGNVEYDKKTGEKIQ